MSENPAGDFLHHKIELRNAFADLRKQSKTMQSHLDALAKAEVALEDAAKAEGARLERERLRGLGVWAQVHFQVKEEERTMFCFFPEDLPDAEEDQPRCCEDCQHVKTCLHLKALGWDNDSCENERLTFWCSEYTPRQEWPERSK